MICRVCAGPLPENRREFCSDECQKEGKRQYLKDYYRANRPAYRARKKGYGASNKALIQEAKAQPCMDCGNSYPSYVMDFDHLGDKKFGISKGHKTSKGALLAEINKCELVCANCHRIRTHNRKHTNRVA